MIPLFWNVIQRHLVIGLRRFEATWWHYFRGSKCPGRNIRTKPFQTV